MSKPKKPSVKIRRVHADDTTCTHRLGPSSQPRERQQCPGATGYEAACGCGCGWKTYAGIRAIVEDARRTYLGRHPAIG
ncbi:hypothetical protein [Nonomuraea sp. NPDC049646]|uniref:hypothetical protein n=1 Tax=unclassified Nonomuraea TaxID=2593643 RepID=UPI0037A391EC